MHTSPILTTTKSGTVSKLSLYPPPLEPAIAFISPAAQLGKPTVLIDAGIHGNERAPVTAVLDQLDILMSHADFGVIAIPITNPLGYQNNTRYIDTNPDWQNHAHSVGDMGHILGWQDHTGWHEPSKTPDNIYCKHLGDFALDVAKKYNIRFVLDLHEEDHPPVPPGGYIYPLSNPPDALTQAILAIYTSLNIPLLSDIQTRFFEPIKNGQVHVTAGGSFPELLIDKSPGACGYTIETTQNQDFAKRIALHTAILNNLPKFMSLI